MKGKNKRKISIQWSLIALVMTCWILPLLIISGMMGYYITDHINKQVMSSITTSVEYSVEKLTNDLDDAIYSSRQISADGLVRKYYYEFLKDNDEVKLYDNVSSEITKQYRYDNKFLITLMYFKNDLERIYFTENTENVSDMRGFMQVHKFKDEILADIDAFANTLGTRIGFINIDNSIYMVRNMVTERKYNDFAVLVMKLNKENLFNTFTGTVWGKDVTFWINDVQINLKGNVINKDMIDLNNTYGENYYESGDMTGTIFFNKSYSDYKMSYAIEFDKSLLMQELNKFQFIMLLISILIVPLLILVISFFYSNVTKPLDTFLAYYNHLEKGNLGIQINGEFKNREFDYFRTAFNEMSGCLKYQFEKLYKEEIALKDARIMALQSQINPHFLNNTLEIINWEARMGENDRVSRMIESLSTLMDAAMDRKGNPIVTVEEEMKYVDAYLYIIRERIGGRLTINIDVDDDCMHNKVPRLIMQPLIENAVEHGIIPKQEGYILIKIHRDIQFLYIDIENDGKITEEDEQKIKKLLDINIKSSAGETTNLGINNVYQRLKIIYGNLADMSIKMNRFGITIANIIIPYNQSEQ